MRAYGSRIGWLDFLRVLAMLLVIGRHVFDGPFNLTYQNAVELPYLMAAIAGFGWSGVMLFFIVSGYIVGGPMVEKVAAGTFSYGRFLTDRALRLLPAALAVLLFLSIVAPSQRVSAMSFLGPLFLSSYIPYSEDPSAPVFTPHFWTLAVEQHFYIVAPLACALLLPVWKRLKGLVSLELLIVATVVLIALFSLVKIQVNADLRASHWFLDFFAIGVLLYFFRSRFKDFGGPSAWLVVGLYAVCALAASVVTGSPLSNMNSNYSVVLALVASAALFICAATARGALGRFLSHGMFRFLGAASYSIYLVHFFVIHRWGALDWLSVRLRGFPVVHYLASCTLAIVGSVIAGVALHVTVEKAGLYLRDSIHSGELAEFCGRLAMVLRAIWNDEDLDRRYPPEFLDLRA